MAQPKTQSFISSLFWPAMTLLAALIAGGIFAFVFAEIGENGWRQGAFLGALVFVVAVFLFGRLGSGTLPPPNTVRINPKPAPTVPRRASAPPAAPLSGESGAAARSSVEDVKSTVDTAFGKLREAVKTGTDKLSDAASGITSGSDTAETRSDTAAETPTASARVTDAAKAAGEAARLMDEPVAANDAAQQPEAVKPLALEAPRDGGPDDLKKIKGVGPKLEALLHSLGFYHFDQIAEWGPGEIAWVDSNLEGFNGRATRDDWVGQAKILAAGGTTEFSERVEKDDIYDED